MTSLEVSSRTDFQNREQELEPTRVKSFCSLSVNLCTYFEINVLQNLVDLCWGQTHLKTSLYSVFQGGVMSLLYPSAFCSPLCCSNNLLGSAEPSVRHLTSGLEKMTQALSLKCHCLPSTAEKNLPINHGLRKHTGYSGRQCPWGCDEDRPEVVVGCISVPFAPGNGSCHSAQVYQATV